MVIKQTVFGHREDIWMQARTEARGILEHVAKLRGTLTYTDLCKKISLIKFQPEGHDLHELLYQISEESEMEGRGLITALVVHKHDYQPGGGFFKLAEKFGRDISDREQCWTTEVNKVFESYSKE